jgi:hypothetical protein
MRKTRLIRGVRAQLDRSSRELDPKITERLFLARQAALGRKRARVPVLAALGARFDMEEGVGPVLASLAGIMLLVGALAFWHAQQHIIELEEVDSAILIDDLPLDAYVDKGFDAWLRRSDAQ